MLKSLKYRISPTSSQAKLINKHINSCRFVYNLALETKQMAYNGNKINITGFDLIKQLPDLKEECQWLKEVNSQSLQQSIANLDSAFTCFFKGQGNFPNFKKKNEKQSFSILQNIRISNNKLYIPKFREGIKIILHCELKGIIKQAIISKTSTEKYFISILVETNILIPKKKKIEEKTTVGIDLGLKTFLVSSDGKEYANPKFLHRIKSKLRYTNCKYSKHKGKRTKQKLALLYEKITNQRKDFLHKVSIELIKNHDSIAIENLNVAGMLKNHKLAKSISDASWGMFIDMLKYKAEWHGKNILQIGRFEPSSKTCSNCSSINKDLKLKDRIWICMVCNSTHDRDLNAAINIKNFALRNLCTEHTLKNQKELSAVVEVMTSEALIF